MPAWWGGSGWLCYVKRNKAIVVSVAIVEASKGQCWWWRDYVIWKFNFYISSLMWVSFPGGRKIIPLNRWESTELPYKQKEIPTKSPIAWNHVSSLMFSKQRGEGVNCQCLRFGAICWHWHCAQLRLISPKPQTLRTSVGPYGGRPTGLFMKKQIKSILH